MKKIVMLSAAAILGLSSMTISQAETNDAEATAADTTSEATAEVATEEASADEVTTEEAEGEEASNEGEEAAPAPAPVEEEAIPQDTPQVQKLIALYPQLVQRIQPYGKVCFEGEDCDITLTASSGGSADGPRDGKAVYDAICQTCHASGVLGAPVLGDAGAWGPRIGKGKDTLYDHAMNGFNAMPARGGGDIPDEEVINAVDYMVEAAS